MNLFKKVISLIIAVTLSGFLISSSYVSATQVSEENYVNSMTEQFHNMTNEELNEFITNVSLNQESNYATASVTGIYSVELKLAWLAAAQIAINLGYPCAGTLVSKSVANSDYYEDSGSFASKIKATTAYKNWSKNTSISSVEIVKSDNADLFYALHNVNINIIGSSSSGARVLVADVFDFAFDNNYDDLFTTAVNNWGWLSQQIHILNPISVTIYFYA